MNSQALIRGIEYVTAKWCKQRKREERESSAQLNRWSAMTRRRSVSIKEAAWSVMEQAYLKASGNGTLPAHARQIMYAARGEILRITAKDQLDDAYFTQTLLPDYISEHKEAQAWDVVYDARGHFQEPHNDAGELPLGTIDVRQYINDVTLHEVDPVKGVIAGGDRYPTCGPRNRYSALLFIEKEGFLPLFNRVKLAQRFDLAIMSTKGVSNVASRTLIDSICGKYDIPLLVLHDFDADGFKILGTLSNNTRRYTFEHSFKVIDLGLRLADVESHGLESETVLGNRNIEDMLHAYDATPAEIDFLRSKRVELNAFGSAEFVAWIEHKLNQHGIKKVTPSAAVQADAYRRAVEAIYLKQAIEDAADSARSRANDIPIPKDLNKRVHAKLKNDSAMAWDDAISEMAKQRKTAG